MTNILLPSMGSSSFFKDSFFPKPLIEVAGKTMLETVAENFKTVLDGQFIYVFSQDDCNQFHIDKSAQLLNDNAKILALKNQTAGALCTSLIAIEMINNEDSLIIANSDQIIDVDYSEVLAYFNEHNGDAGVITFQDIHPRWSYVQTMGKEIVEVAEKRPLSNRAIAGFYYYRKGEDFIDAAMSALTKKSSVEGKYYISASFNELILKGAKVIYYDIDKRKYHSFYSPAKIKEYEEMLK